ncbi:cobyrinic acid a,c-diamide synthase [Undibacterium sp. YM2]|uniref:cobyrinate a,c-diamide synthase n=1 Tax=Undibacterium sp. YM2 TaxID=2058625 RepID=UPI001331F2FA|nr:cobyrinate a,c-diamide synthase [Undibacterium sp. YM2]BBB66113.1 cobyrinic acid a,c-diamide synthase [Undibacterium sp. YM2]
MVRPSAKVVLISAIASGQGKTTTTAALARKLVKLGKTVRVFKTGPDFIDPMMLERACGSAVHSLDLWMVGQADSEGMLARAALDADAILIEGVMGLYDGNPSSADLARAFGVPVVAVLDASAMAQTVGALAMGLRDFGPVHLAGVIANRIASEGHAKMVAAAMRDIPLLGSLRRQDEALPERHLGLVLPQEVDRIEAILDAMADSLELDMQTWDALPETSFELQDHASQHVAQSAASLAGKTIAIARDAAFAFIYPANIECLIGLGAELVFFSPLADEAIPAQADALYLPGGYPELHAKTLTQASNWLASLHAAHAQGMTILAECGGMMAITEGLVDQQEQSWPMAGILPGKVIMQKRLAALGAQALATPQGELRGHTFHYSRFETSLAASSHTIKHSTQQQGEAIYRVGNVRASYFHAYFASNPAATAALFLRDKI